MKKNIMAHILPRKMPTERAAPGTVINDVQMMGASGRVFMSGTTAELNKARDAIINTLESVKGRAS